MNKNILRHKFGLLAMLFLAVLSITFTSCKDDDDEGYGTPEITGVRTCDPEKADSLFDKAGCGSVIAIIGNNLSDVRNVYINDQSVSFNSTMNTSHSLIVTIPTEEKGFKLSAFDSNLKDEIRVETSHGTAVYQFKVLAPYPVMSRIAALYPREAGNTMQVYGFNLVDIQKVYLTDVTGDALDTTVWDKDNVPGNHIECEYKTVKADHAINPENQAYRTFSVVDVTVPQGAPEHGALVFECAAGTVYLNFNYLPGKPVITSCSNDMPEIGETLVLTGRDFTQIDQITYGDVTLKLADGDYTVSESEDSIYIPFDKKPSVEGNNRVLTITNPAGSASVDNFYDYSTILTTFDGDATDNGWGPNAVYEDAGNADGKYARINVTDNGSNWWGTMIYFRKDWEGNSFPLSDNIPATASAKDVYLAYNAYDNGSDLNNGVFGGFFQYLIEQKSESGDYLFGGSLDNTNPKKNPTFSWIDYKAGTFQFTIPAAGDINGKNPKGKWYRAVVSLDNFLCFQGLTYGDIVAKGINQFRIMEMNETTTKGKVDVKFDNIRVIYIPKK